MIKKSGTRNEFASGLILNNVRETLVCRSLFTRAANYFKTTQRIAYRSKNLGLSQSLGISLSFSEKGITPINGALKYCCKV
ncbi:hypothetical protein QWZ13_18295 [Reinekea marina]|uniref:hypothetical protein n=1 Tax=Reinekea marina TaxID=1310421 RepID=UPI0025B416B9|nr:hypothetical protein [Reinekea marina]MDN3650862.1 hypothetical protein [Reinekea marina]